MALPVFESKDSPFTEEYCTSNS